MDNPKHWAMEVYQGKQIGEENVVEEEDDILEMELDVEEVELATKFMAIDVFYSRKSYNLQILFSGMLSAWGIQQLVAVEKIEDYNFKLEFCTEEEKKRVIEGGPWRNNGDALIVVHYDGLARPTEVRIESLSMWIHLYDSPPAMMEMFAKQLSGQLGSYIKLAVRYPCYMPVRVDYPLTSPPLPHAQLGCKD
jgi:hypothetical protein